ncbi:MAG TPA: alpha/beta hydrolase [Rhizomicrobium sp.]|jgi:pimeloyl-ACP methyl ester carboxylesterase|nr:alpha/beta hydrolase [Rhizomicrobium sp.]
MSDRLPRVILSLPKDDGHHLAYARRAGRVPKSGPGVVWLGGFKSDMTGTKACALDAWAEVHDHAFVRFDYFGHGVSSGNFREGTVTRWRDDCLAVLDRLTEGPQILVGSSMGGHLALLTALARPERVAGLLLIAPAADFTEALLWNTYPQDVQRRIMEQGEYLWPSLYDPDPYPVTRTLIEDGRKHLLLDRPVPLACPIRILQGMADPDVPWEHALRLMERLGPDTQLTLIKDGDHRLSKPHEIAAILRVLESMSPAEQSC